MPTLADYGQTTKTSTRGVQVPISPTPITSGPQIVNGQFISSPSAVPISGHSVTSNTFTPNPTPVVPAGYSILTDPTYIGNLGPAPGQGWTDTVSGGQTVAGFQGTYDALNKPTGIGLTNAGPGAAERAYVATIPQGSAPDPILIQQARLLDAQKANEAENKRQLELKAATETANRNANNTAAGNTLGAFKPNATGAVNATNNPNTTVNQRADERAKMRLDQEAIDHARSIGMSDQQIQQSIADGTLPPAPTTSPTVDTPTTPAPTSPAPTDSKAPAPTTPAPNPQGNVLRQLAATETDPLMKIILNAKADEIDAMTVADPMSIDAFAAGKDAAALTKPYDAIQTILDNASKTASETQAAKESFLKGQYERNEKLIAGQQESTNNQLQFQNDRAVRDQLDANKKNIDSKTIMLALGGGFGSTDGNNEIAEARLKGEQAIIDLNKEYGFKRADVSLQFTQMHNQAFDNYQVAWLDATDNFETKIQNISLQGISNQAARGSAITTAYKEYVTEIKDARKAKAKAINDATEFVYNAKLQEDKIKYDRRKDERDQKWDEYKFEFTSNLALLKEQNDQMQAANTAADRQDAKAVAADAKSLTTMNTVTNGLNGRINNDPIIREALQIRPKYNTLKNVYESSVEQEKLYESGKISKKSMSFTDQVLISNFNKLTDPTSVVRESEYARSAAGLSLIESIRAKYDAIQAGGVLTKDARQELFDVATTLNESYTDMFNQKSQQYYLQLDQYNSNVAPQYQMTPEQFGLPVPKTSSQKYNLEQLAPEGLFPLGNPFEDNPPATDENGYQSFNFGDKKVVAAPVMISALARADQAFFADTGKHLDINSSMRSAAQQQAAYDRYQKGEIALAAKPGTSFHEKGLAVDVTNWKEAEPYLIAAGIYPLPKNLRSSDPAHFSIGESPIS